MSVWSIIYWVNMSQDVVCQHCRSLKADLAATQSYFEAIERQNKTELRNCYDTIEHLRQRIIELECGGK